MNPQEIVSIAATASLHSIWRAYRGGNLEGFLVTEAAGRLAEPIALVYFGTDKVTEEEGLLAASQVAVNPAGALRRYRQCFMPRVPTIYDLRGERGGLPHCFLKNAVLYSHGFTGEYMDYHRSVVIATGEREPAPAPDERALEVKKVRGRFHCPHCEKKYKVATCLVNHLRAIHQDGMTANAVAA